MPVFAHRPRRLTTVSEMLEMDQSRNDAASPRRFRKGEPTVREGRLSTQEQTCSLRASIAEDSEPVTRAARPDVTSQLRAHVTAE